MCKGGNYLFYFYLETKQICKNKYKKLVDIYLKYEYLYYKREYSK